MQKPVAIQAPSRGRVVGAWIVQGLLAAAFLAAGGAKLAGVPMMVQIFDQIGMGQRSEERRVGKECRSRWSPYH